MALGFDNLGSLDWSRTPETIELEADAGLLSPPSLPLHEFGPLTAWELQSQLATIALVALVAFVPILAAIGIMITWAMIATLAYYVGRQHGFPDLLETRWSAPPVARKEWRRWVGSTLVSLVKTWVAGIQPYIYTRIFCPVLARPVRRWYTGIVRFLVLTIGLTLFGVTATHHLLKRAGFGERAILRYSLVGPLLNVPYRVVFSAVLLNAVLNMTKGMLG
jgi:hypothetical protein